MYSSCIKLVLLIIKIEQKTIMKDWGKEEMKSFLVTITYNTLLNHAKTAFLLTAFFLLGMLCAYGKLLLLAHKTIFILIIYLSFGIIFIMAHMHGIT